MLGVRARRRRPFPAPLVMDQLTCTFFFFSGLVRPVFKHGTKSPTVGQVYVVDAEPASAWKAPVGTSAPETNFDLESGSRMSVSCPPLSLSLSLCLSISFVFPHFFLLHLQPCFQATMSSTRNTTNTINLCSTNIPRPCSRQQDQLALQTTSFSQ